MWTAGKYNALVLGIIGLLVWIGTAIAAVAGVAWFDSLLLPEEAEVGQTLTLTPPSWSPAAAAPTRSPSRP